MPLDLATASISAEEVGLIRILPSDDSEKHLIGMFPKERIVFIPGLNGALQRVLLSISSSIFARSEFHDLEFGGPLHTLDSAS